MNEVGEKTSLFFSAECEVESTDEMTLKGLLALESELHRVVVVPALMDEDGRFMARTSIRVPIRQK